MADIDLLPKMILCPLRDGYNVTLGDDVITTQFENGMPRQRLNGVGRPHQVGVTFRHKAQHQEYLYNFWQFNKAKPFAMRLIIGNSELLWYECRFIGSPATLSLGADVHEFSISLVVKPKPFDKVVAQEFIDAYLLTGGDLTGYLNILEQLVNYHLPEEVGLNA